LRQWKAIVLLASSQVLPTVLQQGQSAFRCEGLAEAERLFAEAVRSWPMSAVAHKWLGMTYAAEEKFVLAEAPFRRACEIDRNEPEACYYWGRTLFSLSRFEAALQAYEKDAKPRRGKTCSEWLLRWRH